jgi:transposase
VKDARDDFRLEQGHMEADSLVFLDETGANTGMTRLYGRAFEGERVVDYVPDVRFERTTLLSSVRLDGTTVPVCFEGALNGEIFKTYISDCLAPTLKIGDIVFMDRLSSHMVNGVIEAIEAKGAFVFYLPPYSSDLNPIEQMWSKIKAYIRKVKARTKEALFEAIRDALNLVSIPDIAAWFLNAGYSVDTVKVL